MPASLRSIGPSLSRSADRRRRRVEGGRRCSTRLRLVGQFAVRGRATPHAAILTLATREAARVLSRQSTPRRRRHDTRREERTARFSSGCGATHGEDKVGVSLSTQFSGGDRGRRRRRREAAEVQLAEAPVARGEARPSADEQRRRSQRKGDLVSPSARARSSRRMVACRCT